MRKIGRAPRIRRRSYVPYSRAVRKRRRRRRLFGVLLLALTLAAIGFFWYRDRTALTGTIVPQLPEGFDPSEVPPYSGEPFAEMNGGQPYFTEEERRTEPFALYGELDALGRCTFAEACIGPEQLPEGDRGEISTVTPSGWHAVRCAEIDGGFLYNRCHLIAWELTGENANERNLITGTRHLNVEGMLPFENRAASCIRMTGKHVLYRATPVFSGRDLVCRGVLREAFSVEDQGNELSFCVFCYNVQPGFTIRYADGSVSRNGSL